MNQPEVCLVSRNQEMYDDMAYLKNRLRDTDILQECFIPYERMPEFVDSLREIVQRNKANLLNVTIRTVHKDTVTALPYAKQDMFGFVLYFNVGFNDRDNEVLRNTTTDLIDASARSGGLSSLPVVLFQGAIAPQLSRSQQFLCHEEEVRSRSDCFRARSMRNTGWESGRCGGRCAVASAVGKIQGDDPH